MPSFKYACMVGVMGMNDFILCNWGNILGK
jgi:hypothetical protein